jgi:ribosomal protein L24E
MKNMFDKPRNTKWLRESRENAKGELDPRSGKIFLILVQEPKHGKTERCPFCGKYHLHGVGDGHRVAHCGFNEITFTNGQGIRFSSNDGYIIKTKERGWKK